MRARSVVLGMLALLLSTFAATEVRAESAAVEKIVALNKSAIGAFGAGDHEKAKTQLMEAVVLGKENGLGMHASMARTYLHLGVVYVDGFKDKEKGQRYFAMAQKVRSDIELTPSLASPSVKAAFDAARGAEGGAKTETAKAEPAKVESPPEAAKPEPKVVEKKETKAEIRAREKAEKAARDEEARAAKAADKASQIIDDSKTARFEEKITALQGELHKTEQEARGREQQLRDEKQKLQQELAQARESAKQQLAENTRLQNEERKLQVQLAERDKKLAAKDGEVADARAEAKREREARQNAEKQEREARQSAEKQDKEKSKLIADASDREKKAREAADKLEKEKQLAETRDKERKEREAQERAAREKLAEGPELPANIPQPLYCGNKDEGVLGAELFIHCVPQAQVKARSLVLYYRTTGNAHYDAATMTHTKKGWWAAAIPANRVTGKSLQYYAEARGPRDEVSAHNGKAESPNILALRSAEAVAKKAASSSDPLADLTAKASSKSTTKAKKTAASKRTKARR